MEKLLESKQDKPNEEAIKDFLEELDCLDYGNIEVAVKAKRVVFVKVSKTKQYPK